MRALAAPHHAHPSLDPAALWPAGFDGGLAISTGWGGDPPGTFQGGPRIPLAAIATSLDTTPAAIAGGEFQRIETIKAWNTFKNIAVTASALDEAAGGALLVGNFVDVRIDLSGQGDRGFDLLVIGAKRGLIHTSTGTGADTVTLVSHSNEGVWSNLMVINTFGGDDRIDVTTVSISLLDDVMLAGASGNGALWNPAYDGRFSRYVIEAGDGDDAVIVSGLGHAVIGGGAGDDVIRCGGGHDRIDGGAGTDVLFGGAGNDTFVLRFGEIEDDVIADFSRGGAGGRDTILFLGFSADAQLMLLDTTAGLFGITDGPGTELALFLVQGLGGMPLGSADYVFG